MHARHAFIFDLDGTLVNSLDDIADALNAALAHFGREPKSREMMRGWVGDGLPALCLRAAPDADENTRAALFAHASTVYRQGCLRRTRPYDNILKMLDLLRAAGVEMAVLSNKPHELTLRVVEGLKWVEYFLAVRGYVSEEERKPSPVVALQLAAQMGAPAGSVMLVGDSVVDVRTARNAGMRAVAVTWGFQSRQDLAAATPDHLVDDPLDLVHLVSRE